MSTSETLLQIFEDARFAIVNLADVTKQFLVDLGSIASGKTVTIRAQNQDNIVINLPVKSGTLELLEAERTTIPAPVVDFKTTDIGVMDLASDVTLVLTNPVQGKSMMLEVAASQFTLNFPSYVKILSGRFKLGATNYVYFHCVNEAVPVYLVTIGQQQA
jgi:hypothetical protein